MAQATYKQIAKLLAEKREFKGNSMSAIWHGHPDKTPVIFLPVPRENLPAKVPVYIVYSYGTVIAWCVPGLFTEVKSRYYSRTTSRHQGLCRTWL